MLLTLIKDEIQKEKPLEKKFFSDIFQHKGFALKKLGMREDAQKCFTTSFTISNAIDMQLPSDCQTQIVAS